MAETPTSVWARGRVALHQALGALPAPPGVVSRPRPLAPPPPGSGLRPIMGDYGYPVVGWTLNWMYRGPLPWNADRRAEYGRLSWGGMFGRRVVTIADPDAIEQVMRNADGHWSNEEGWRWIIGPFFDGGIMLMDDPVHHRDRRIMAQAFTRKRLEAYLRRLAGVTGAAIERWVPGTMHAYPVLKQLTLDVATDVFLDGAMDDAVDGAVDGTARAQQVNRAFIDCVRAGTGLVRADVPLTRWTRGLAGRRLLEAYFADKVPAHRGSDGDDLLTGLCHARTEDGEAFSDDAIVAHMIFLMMAAHDTATITTNAILYFLAQHADWQERCREESRAAADDVLAFGDLGQLESLDLVMREAMRMIPPVPAMGRMAVADTELVGHHVPAGTASLIAPLPIHHDPVLWRSPQTFDPERFAPHRREDKIHQYAYLPFGGGAHKCIGMHFGQMEVKTTIHQILRRFRVTSPRTTPSPWDWTSLPKPLDDLPLVLTRV